jgi:3-isopropylmalate/(R)-2-methylmalate dehydratase small subunit
MSVPRVQQVEGRALPLRGHDIDTDRIMPARYLRSVSFEGLEAHVFEDDRRLFPASQGVHPFGDPRFAGARVLLVNRNFGCGSSREHAPQGIYRWGIHAIVGESFSEIFFGNAVALGMPCVSVPPAAAAALQDAVASDPSLVVTVDLERLVVSCGDREVAASLPAAARDAFRTGAWDATGMLLDRFEEVEAVGAKLPYVSSRW